MKCRFCGYVHGFQWVDGEYVVTLGIHGDFYRFLAERYNIMTGNGKHMVVMCPNPDCQRTQLEE